MLGGTHADRFPTTLMLRFGAKNPSFFFKTRVLFVLCTFFLHEPPTITEFENKISKRLLNADV